MEGTQISKGQAMSLGKEPLEQNGDVIIRARLQELQLRSPPALLPDPPNQRKPFAPTLSLFFHLSFLLSIHVGNGASLHISVL